MWDVEQAVVEVERAHGKGLKGVNFPAMREGELPEYNDLIWEPLWSVCEERKIPLVTHVGGGSRAKYRGPEATSLMQMETGGFFSRRAIWWLIFGGVFERHPGLKIVITETPGNWMPTLAEEMDVIWRMRLSERHQQMGGAEFYAKVPRLPSEYVATNVFFGASFASPYEAEQATLNGLESQFMWGSDYPHIEGTFVNPDGSDMPSVTRLALRNTFCKLSADKVRAMVGGNAIAVYDLDAASLRAIANEIGAPTAEELARPIDAVPDGAAPLAFRSGRGAWS
jgi:predicted TIM-barrel fold metal-dependent hydrolase